MAAFPQFTVEDLSNNSGRSVAEYTNSAFIPTAVAQATLLFKLGTCLGDRWPDDPTMAELAKTAILSMADAIYLVQPFQEVLANPFSSESIGSYSYSKVAGAVLGGLPTGIMWFDLALSHLSVCDVGLPTGGGIEIFEHDAYFTAGMGNNVRFLSPGEVANLQAWGHDPAPGYRGTPDTVPVGGSSDSGGSVDGGGFGSSPDDSVWDGGSF